MNIDYGGTSILLFQDSIQPIGCSNLKKKKSSTKVQNYFFFEDRNSETMHESITLVYNRHFTNLFFIRLKILRLQTKIMKTMRPIRTL